MLKLICFVIYITFVVSYYHNPKERGMARMSLSAIPLNVTFKAASYFPHLQLLPNHLLIFPTKKPINMEASTSTLVTLRAKGWKWRFRVYKDFHTSLLLNGRYLTVRYEKSTRTSLELLLSQEKSFTWVAVMVIPLLMLACIW